MGVVTTATQGQTRLRGPFSKKQLVKATWRRSGFYRIRMLKGCSPLLTSMSDRDLWPQGPVGSGHLRETEACILTLPVSYHLPVCSGSDKGLKQKGGCASIATGRRLRLNWFPVCLCEYLEITKHYPDFSKTRDLSKSPNQMTQCLARF